MLPTLWKYAAPLPSLRSFSTSPGKTSLPSSQSPSQSTAQPCPPQRYAIIGGGFAGVAVAWHLMKHSSPHSPIQIELFDAYGLGAGGSGAAAGLLHPYTPRGTLLWQGLTAFQASLDLVNAAETEYSSLDGYVQQKMEKRKQFVWRHGLLRPARTAKQAKDFLKNAKNGSCTTRKKDNIVSCEGRCILSYEELVDLVPGLDPKLLFPDNNSKNKERTATAEETSGDGAVGFFVEQAVVINPHDYLTALWESCLYHAGTSSPLASAQLHLRSIPSLTELDRQEGPFDGIVVAAGAAVDSIVETAGVLNLDLCQGYTLDMQLLEKEERKDESLLNPGAPLAPSHDGGSAGNSTGRGSSNSSSHINKEINKDKKQSLAYPEGAPGLLGSPYISPQGTHRAIVGATQQHGCSVLDAVAALGPGSFQKKKSKEWNEAVEALVPAAAQLWPPIGRGFSFPAASSDVTTDNITSTKTITDSTIMSGTWQVHTVRSGYRAIPQRTAEGSIPYAGKLNLNSTQGAVDGSGAINDLSAASISSKNWWIVGGLGARGLVYHGWLGKLVAEGMMAKSDEQMPKQLRRWKEDSAPANGET